MSISLCYMLSWPSCCWLSVPQPCLLSYTYSECDEIAQWTQSRCTAMFLCVGDYWLWSEPSPTQQTFWWNALCCGAFILHFSDWRLQQGPAATSVHHSYASSSCSSSSPQPSFFPLFIVILFFLRLHSFLCSPTPPPPHHTAHFSLLFLLVPLRLSFCCGCTWVTFLFWLVSIKILILHLHFASACVCVSKVHAYYAKNIMNSMCGIAQEWTEWNESNVKAYLTLPHLFVMNDRHVFSIW